MKLFISRDNSDGTAAFIIFDELGFSKYTVTVVSEKRKQKMLILDSERNPVSEILHKQFVMDYFTVRCRSRLYVLVPYCKECFSFAVYGSTYRFAGDISAGSFSLFDVDKSPVMTQKKCWSKYGSGYEVEIYLEDQEHFALSTALCADLYISAAKEDPIYS